MKLNDYQNAARKTAIYPGKLTYPALGLCGEVGELTLACVEDTDQVPKEIGDVLWYVANVAHDAGLSLKTVCGKMTFLYRGDPYWDCNEACEALAINAGRVAQNVKKSIRDNDGVLPLHRRRNIQDYLMGILVALASVAKKYDTTLDQCAKDNLVKLQSRAERGVLKGDGDNR